MGSPDVPREWLSHMDLAVVDVWCERDIDPCLDIDWRMGVK